MARAGLGLDMEMDVSSMEPPNPLLVNGYHVARQPNAVDLLHCNGLCSRRKRSHPDARLLTNGIFTSDNCMNGLGSADTPNGVILDGTKRACLDSVQARPQLAEVATSGADVPMECAAYLGRVNGICMHPKESPVPKHPGGSGPNSHGSPFSVRKLQLYSMEVPCCSSNLSALECPRCLAGEPGHLKHIFDSHIPAPHGALHHTHGSSSDFLTMAHT